MFYWKKSGNIWKGCNLTPRAAHKYFQRECKNHQGEVTSAPHAYFSWLTKPLLQHKPLGLWLTTTWHISQADLFFPCPSCPIRLKKYSLPPLPEKILLNQDKFPHSPFFFLFSSTCCEAFLPNSWILLQVPASCLWQSSWPASGSFQPHSKDVHWAWTTEQVPSHQETPGAHLLTITSPWLLMSTGATFSLSPLNSCCPHAGKIKSPQPAGHQTVHFIAILKTACTDNSEKEILMGIWGPSIQMKFRSNNKWSRKKLFFLAETSHVTGKQWAFSPSCTSARHCWRVLTSEKNQIRRCKKIMEVTEVFLISPGTPALPRE